ncbi:stalk domain-containing protein [Paenibacillus hodogayensis]|uniref:Stalk domain-containing protein n=1 Tax=Paenibacillus hodogayensis TaxID=279208 RepID=A0ABV5VZ76_9BACL
MKKMLKTTRQLAAASLALALIVPAASAFAQETPSAGAQPVTGIAKPAGDNRAVAPSAATVPLREYSEAIGGAVVWNAAESSAIVFRGNVKVIAKIGDSVLKVNEKSIPLEEPVRLVNEKTIVPLSALNEAFGVRAGWDAAKDAVVAGKDDYPLLASGFINAWNKGNLAQARSYMNSSFSKLMPDELLQQYWANVGSMYGELGPLFSAGQSTSPVHRNVALLYQTEASAMEMTVRFDTYGQIDDLFLSSSPSGDDFIKPAYDKPELYTEKDVTIGDGALALPGTLTTPAGKGPFPVVVLVHGSGPNDRDETIGGVKTFRDIAVGLAAQGIATLRYEKVTREHSLKVQLSGKSLTANEETVDDAVRAIGLMKRTEGIDPSRIYVAGHSQGGMLMPRIIEAAKNDGLKGAIVLAGPSRPLEDLILEQLKFQFELVKQSGQPVDMFEQQLALYEQQVKLLKDPKYTVGNPPPGFLLGDPAWWLDIRNLYAGEASKNQKVPLLVVQGGNDAQVFPDNLDGWKKSLSSRTDVEYKLYPKLNHTLVEFDGPSTGAEYATPANVPDYLITDMAKWIKH